jgi:hypothetical protein
MDRLDIATFADINVDFDIRRVLLQFKYEFPGKHCTSNQAGAQHSA